MAKGPSYTQRLARKLRIAHGLEDPPKRRRRKAKSTVGGLFGMKSIFDDAPDADDDDED